MARRRPKSRVPAGVRNGLKWRAGRPRWEPSPASRAAELKGLDLKDAAGAWLSYGAAIDAAEARALWAALIREADRPGPPGADARAVLARALEALPAPKDAEGLRRRALLDDLIAAARARLGQPTPLYRYAPGPRTCAAMCAGYFADVDAGKVEISAATRKNYKAMAKRFVARFGHLAVGELKRSTLRDWYMELKAEVSIHTANLALGAAGAFLRWAAWQDWIADSPATKLGRTMAPGRRVFWTREEELSFMPWCDAHGFADVADGAVLGLWTGARPWDLCAAALPDLAGATWRYTPHKTAKRAQEALPGLLEPVKARLRRRTAEAAGDAVRWLGPTPFLVNPATGRRHDTASLAGRYRDAKAAALLAGAVPDSLQGKQMRDTRDACVTRLYLAGVPLDRIPGWTGHSPSDRDEILREHYLCLLEEAALEDAAKLETWAKTQGLVL